VRDLQPVPANQNQPNQSTPVSTITIPGTVVTSTIYTTITTTVTSTVETVVTRTATTTVSTVAVVTVTAEVSTTPTTVTTAVAPSDATLAMEKSRILVLIAETTRFLEQLKQRDPTRRDIDYAIADLKKLGEQVERASTLSELKSIENRVRDIASRFQVPTVVAKPEEEGEKVYTVTYRFQLALPTTPVPTPPPEIRRPVQGTAPPTPAPVQPPPEAPVAELKATIKVSTKEGRVESPELNFRAYIRGDSVTVSQGDTSYTLSKDEVAKLFASLLASSMAFNRDTWSYFYTLAGGDKFRESLVKWMRGEKLSDEDLVALANGVYALASYRPLFDLGTASRVDINYANLLKDGLEKMLSSSERFSIGLRTMFRPSYEDYWNAVAEKIKRGEIPAVPGEGKWTFQDLASKFIQYTPLSIVFNRIKDALTPLVGSATATAVASAAITAILSAVPVVGGAVGGATGAAVGASISQALLLTSLTSAALGIANLATTLTDPIARQAFIDWIKDENNLKALMMEIAAATMGSATAAIAMQKILPEIIASPRIWSRLPDQVKKNLTEIGYVRNVPEVRGTVVEVKILELPADKIQVKTVHDPNTKSISISVSFEGEAKPIEFRLPKELSDKFIAILEAQGIVGDTEKARFITDRFSTLIKSVYIGSESRDIAIQKLNALENLLRRGDRVAIQLLENYMKRSVVGELMFASDSSRIALLDKNTNTLYIGFSEKQLLRNVVVDEKASLLIESAIIRNDLTKIGNLIEKISSTVGVGKQIYIDTARGVGTYANVLNFRLAPVEPGEADYIVQQLQRLADLIRLDIAFRQQLLSGGIPRTQLALKYGFDPAFLSNPQVIQLAQNIARIAGGGIDFGLIFIPSLNTLNIGVIAFAPTIEALNQAVAKAVQQGLKPEAIGLRVVPIHRQAVETAITTKTVEAVSTRVAVYPTAVTQQIPLAEKPVHRVETASVVLTRTVDFVVTKTVTTPTVIAQVVELKEHPIYRTETVPALLTRTVDLIATKVVVYPTAVTQQIPLAEQVIHRTATQTALVTLTTTTTVVITTSVLATVVETGTVTVVTVPVTITYTYTVPITIATAVPAPAPATPTETAGAVVAKPTLPRLPGLEGVGLVRAQVKPEQKPKLEKEVLVI
jgi:hypothetical protein